MKLTTSQCHPDVALVLSARGDMTAHETWAISACDETKTENCHVLDVLVLTILPAF